MIRKIFFKCQKSTIHFTYDIFFIKERNFQLAKLLFCMWVNTLLVLLSRRFSIQHWPRDFSGKWWGFFYKNALFINFISTNHSSIAMDTQKCYKMKQLVCLSVKLFQPGFSVANNVSINSINILQILQKYKYLLQFTVRMTNFLLLFSFL